MGLVMPFAFRFLLQVLQNVNSATDAAQSSCLLNSDLLSCRADRDAVVAPGALREKSKESAEGAQYESQGQARAKRSASPLVTSLNSV